MPEGQRSLNTVLSEARRATLAWESAGPGTRREQEAAEKATRAWSELDDAITHGATLPDPWRGHAASRAGVSEFMDAAYPGGGASGNSAAGGPDDGGYAPRHGTNPPEPEFDPIPDVAGILAGLQVPRSMAGGRVLGAAMEPYDDLRLKLGAFGWLKPADYELMFRQQMSSRSRQLEARLMEQVRELQARLDATQPGQLVMICMERDVQTVQEQSRDEKPGTVIRASDTLREWVLGEDRAWQPVS